MIMPHTSAGADLSANQLATDAVTLAREWVDESGDRPLLHAWKLGFDHPQTGERMEWTAAPPADFRAILELLGFVV